MSKVSLLINQASQGRLAHFNAQNRSHEEWLRTFVLEGSRSAHPSMMVRKSVVDTVGTNPYYAATQRF